MVDAATGEELDFTVDSPSVNGEKMEVFFYVLFPLSMAMLLVGIDYFVVLLFVGLFVNVDVIGEVALWSLWSSGGEPAEDHGELLHHQQQHGSEVA